VSFPRERPTLPRRIAEPWVHRFVESGDSWIVYGDRSRREALRLGADAARIVTAPPVPPLRAPEGTTVRSAGSRSAGLRFLVVAQLIPRKGIDVVIEAFRALDGPHELWIAGTGPLTAAIEEAATADPRITLLGHLDWEALDHAYREADAAVLPSRYEVWGQVVSEAQAHGMPVVATTAVGAEADLIDEGKTGLVVPPGDAPALAAALRTLAGWDAAQGTACGEAARSTFEAWTVDDAAAAFAEACRLGVDHRRGAGAAA
jgi:glycosyltransferase involved in cell wall biosynthesis